MTIQLTYGSVTNPYLLSSLRPYSTAGYYVKVMKKVMEKGVDYIKNESERLGRILSKPLVLDALFQ